MPSDIGIVTSSRAAGDPAASPTRRASAPASAASQTFTTGRKGTANRRCSQEVLVDESRRPACRWSSRGKDAGSPIFEYSGDGGRSLGTIQRLPGGTALVHQSLLHWRAWILAPS